MSKLDLKAKAGLLYLLMIAITVPMAVGFAAYYVTNNSGKKINAQTPTVLKCDFNADGKVDRQDYLIAGKGFGQVTDGAGNSNYDLNKDGWVNSKDLDAVSSSDPALCAK